MPWTGPLWYKRVGVATLWKHFITMKLSTNETWIYLPIKISYIHILSTCTDASLPPAGHAFLSRLHVDIAALVFPTFQLLVRLILAASKQDDWLVLFIFTEWNWIPKILREPFIIGQIKWDSCWTLRWTRLVMGGTERVDNTGPPNNSETKRCKNSRYFVHGSLQITRMFWILDFDSCLIFITPNLNSIKSKPPKIQIPL